MRETTPEGPVQKLIREEEPVTSHQEDAAPLLEAESDEDHPQLEVVRYGDVGVFLFDSARYCDERNRGHVIVAASYGGTLPARLVAPHRPRAALFHDVGIAADGSGISGLPYLEALGIPAVSVEGSTGELGNARDMYDNGRISRANVLAERCGVERGMSVIDAARHLATGDPGDASASTKVRRKVVDSADTGAKFIEEVSPWGFICADGGTAKNGSGYAGLAPLDEAGLAGACYDVMTAAMGDAFDAWDRGIVSQVNSLAAKRGVVVGQTVQEAAKKLLTSGSQ
jgi:uncharacterized protein YunC (DUF1805 family)